MCRYYIKKKNTVLYIHTNLYTSFKSKEVSFYNIIMTMMNGDIMKTDAGVCVSATARSRIFWSKNEN